MRKTSAFADTLMGMTRDAATEEAKRQGYMLRVVTPEDEDAVHTADLRPHRITLWVDQRALVTRVAAG